MHQIRFRLELRAQTPLGELTALPQTPQLYLKGLLLTERGKRETGGERKVRGRGGREGGKGKGRGREGMDPLLAPIQPSLSALALDA